MFFNVAREKPLIHLDLIAQLITVSIIMVNQIQPHSISSPRPDHSYYEHTE